VILVDNGGFFPESDPQKDYSWFLMDGMRLLGTDAVGMSDKELRFGLSYLKAQVKRTQLPMVCANLVEQPSRKPVLQPYLIKKVGMVRVGMFGLMSDKVDLGPSRDSLVVLEPSAVAKRTVTELRQKGATIIVLLSQLGKVESEDLVTAVDGIDAVIVGRNVPMLQKGRTIKNTVACYGGEQGQYIGRTILALNAQRRMASGENEMFVLGPEVPDKAEVAQLVKAFEDSFNEKTRKEEKEKAAQAETAKSSEASPDHYLGMEACGRCHARQAEQWKTTRHAQAWQTLLDAKKQESVECVQCHSVGYKQPGGFATVGLTPALVNVQCESCHGMGTQHEAFAKEPRKITAQTCLPCHTSKWSPNFKFEEALPKIKH
jgi:2',3'-cyclic-nucleotide 2'-phosphodiesterase (5'-nucleotidase family)